MNITDMVSFDEFVAYGREHGTSVVAGVPWAFNYRGVVVTHENDDHYILHGLGDNATRGNISFRKGETLRVDTGKYARRFTVMAGEFVGGSILIMGDEL